MIECECVHFHQVHEHTCDMVHVIFCIFYIHVLAISLMNVHILVFTFYFLLLLFSDACHVEKMFRLPLCILPGMANQFPLSDLECHCMDQN